MYILLGVGGSPVSVRAPPWGMQVLKVLGSSRAAVYWLLSLYATKLLWRACNWEQLGAITASLSFQHPLSMNWAWDKTIVILTNITCGVQLSLWKLWQLNIWQFSPFLNSRPVSKVKQHHIFITQVNCLHTLFPGGIVKTGTLQKSQFFLWHSARPTSKLPNDSYQPYMENNKAFFEVHCIVIARTCTKNRMRLHNGSK